MKFTLKLTEVSSSRAPPLSHSAEDRTQHNSLIHANSKTVPETKQEYEIILYPQFIDILLGIALFVGSHASLVFPSRKNTRY
jgi:hypothetical protein